MGASRDQPLKARQRLECSLRCSGRWILDEVSAADLDGEIINIGPVGGNVGPPFEPGGSTTVFVRIRNTGTENAHFRVFVHSVSSRWSADDNCFGIFGTTCSVRDVEPGLEPFRTYTVGSPGDGGSGTIIWKLEVASAGCLILHLCDWTEVDTGVLSVFSGERATEFDLDEDPLLDVSGLVDPVGATGRALVIDIPQESGFKVNRNFEGLSAAEAGSDPPDPQIAVGPRHVVELLNNMGASSRRTDASSRPSTWGISSTCLRFPQTAGGSSTTTSIPR